jgi:membrane protease subunit HflK
MRYLLSAVLLLVAAYLFTGVTQIRPGERVVVRRFGRVTATPGPGLWIGLPWGMDRIDRIAVDRVRRVAVGYQPEDEYGEGAPSGQLLTGDHNLVNIQVIVHYAVDDDRLVAFAEQGERADDLVARAAETALAEWVAGQDIDDVLIQGKLVLPQWLVRETQARIADYQLGVRVQDADVTHLFPPIEVKQAFDEVTRAQTAIRTQEHEARQYANRQLREAETEKYRIERQTEAYVTERLRLAEAEADRFTHRLRQYHQLRRANPEFLAGIWWEEMSKLFRRMKDNGQLDLLDHHLGSDGLDLTVFPPLPRKK